MIVSFIAITLNSERFLNDFFSSIIENCNLDNIDFEIIIVDNGSSDRSQAIINTYKQSFPNKIHSTFLSKNYGTTYSRNIGLKNAKGSIIVIIDSDIKLLSGGIRKIISYLESNLDIGIIAPQLLLPDGSVQNSVRKFPTFFHKLKKMLGIFFPFIHSPDIYENFPFKDITAVDTSVSACWIFRNDILEKVGNFDEKIFFSPEDLDYCVRILKCGYKVVYYPDYKVLHHAQQVTHKKPFSRFAVSHFWGLIYFYRKHGGWIIRPKF